MAETKTLEDLGALKGSEPAPAPVHTQKLDAHGRAKYCSKSLALTLILPTPGLIHTRATAFLRLPVA